MSKQTINRVVDAMRLTHAERESLRERAHFGDRRARFVVMYYAKRLGVVS